MLYKKRRIPWGIWKSRFKRCVHLNHSSQQFIICSCEIKLSIVVFQEVLARSALETQKLELMSSLSEMKLRQASLEHENMALRSSSPLTNVSKFVAWLITKTFCWYFFSMLSQGDRFSRHAGHYCSLPRPPNSSKKGVVFGKIPNVTTIQSTNSLAVRGISARCFSAPVLGYWWKSLLGRVAAIIY